MIHAVQTFGLILVQLLVLFSLISVLVALVNRRFGPDRIQSWMADGRLPGPVKGLLLGAITLDNIRRGPAQTGTIGYWIGAPFARQGFMREAIAGLVHHAFAVMDLSRIEAACLPENAASRGVLEKAGFKYEGVAQSYLQINGRWRNHVLYANLRNDRRGRTEVR